MPARRFATLAAFATLAVGLAACSGVDLTPRPVAESEYNHPQEGRTNNGDFNGNTPIITLGVNKQGESDQGANIGVNAYLWRATLDTLSFMPLASADPFGGVIITDWYQPAGTADERFKATAYILSRALRADGVRIVIFRQVRQNGQWTDAPVVTSTVSDIENKVLARARELRSQAG